MVFCLTYNSVLHIFSSPKPKSEPLFNSLIEKVFYYNNYAEENHTCNNILFPIDIETIKFIKHRYKVGEAK